MELIMKRIFDLSQVQKKHRLLIFLAPIVLFSFLFTPARLAPVHALDRPTTQSDVEGGSNSRLASSGIWISQQEIMRLPTYGPAWESVLSTAEGSFGKADVSNQNSNHDVYTMAGALVCARTDAYCDKTVQALKDAIGTEEGARWLAIGRNMTAYTIAADVMRGSGALAGQDLADVTTWLASFLTRTLRDNNSGVQKPLSPFESGSNASAQEAAVYAAIAAYLGAGAPQTEHPKTGTTIIGTQHLDRIWDAFRRYACDPTAPDNEDISIHDDSGWAYYDPTGSNKCGVNPKGATKQVSNYPGFSKYPTEMRTDGVIVNDMDRGCDPKWKPCPTNYPWVGLEGFVPAAWILHRAGYPAFDVADKAVFRALDFLWWLDERSEPDDENSWFLQGGDKADEIVYLVKAVYGQACNPVNGKDCMSEWKKDATGPGRTIGFTDWTHMDPSGAHSTIFCPAIVKCNCKDSLQ
jgi:hypothetical protein